MTRINSSMSTRGRKSDEVRWAQAALVMVAMGMIIGAILGA